MELAAVVVVPEKKDLIPSDEPLLRPLHSQDASRPLSPSLLPVLGNDVLRTWTDRVRKLGVRSLWLAAGLPHQRDLGAAIGDLFRQGVERLLMIKLKSYAEMDLADLIRFHRQSRNSVTEVQDSQGQLGVSVLDQIGLGAAWERELSGPPKSSEWASYPFYGYAKRILSSKERQELVGDALTGACAMRPSGTEIREHVWVGDDVSLADSVKMVGPTYIGDHTIVRAGATIGPFASVERDCVVDWGTTVERSTILPRTHLGPGLLIRHSLVDGCRLEDFECGAVADLLPAGLARRTQGCKSDSQSSSAIFSAQANPAWVSGSSPVEWREVRL